MNNCVFDPCGTVSKSPTLLERVRSGGTGIAVCFLADCFFGRFDFALSFVLVSCAGSGGFCVAMVMRVSNVIAFDMILRDDWHKIQGDCHL